MRVVSFVNIENLDPHDEYEHTYVQCGMGGPTSFM